MQVCVPVFEVCVCVCVTVSSRKIHPSPSQKCFFEITNLARLFRFLVTCSRKTKILRCGLPLADKVQSGQWSSTVPWAMRGRGDICSQVSLLPIQWP